MTKIIFLDIDGPLVNHRTSARSLNGGQMGLMGKFDPIGVNMINALAQDFDAKIVISSTWRLSYLGYMGHVLNTAGIHTNYLYNNGGVDTDWPSWFTPKSPHITGGNGNGRHKEIASWLDKNTITNYVIIDDAQMSKPLSSHAVKVDVYDGLLWGDYLKARSILGMEDEK